MSTRDIYPKRLFDILVASAALLVLWPLMAAVALAVWARLGRPVLFTQMRPGLGGRPFRLFKFRTMIEDGGRGAGDAERMTPFGRFLRSTSLDELPELWNVLRGDMSLVGPRPLLVEYLNLYTPFQMRRHEVRPGITGWAQVNGRNALRWPDRFALDIWYVDHVSFALDLKILFLTAWRVLSREGISAEGEATVPYFDGEPQPGEAPPGDVQASGGRSGTGAKKRSEPTST